MTVNHFVPTVSSTLSNHKKTRQTQVRPENHYAHATTRAAQPSAVAMPTPASRVAQALDTPGDAAPATDEIIIAPQQVQVASPREICATLAAGRPFKPVVAAKLQQIFRRTLTADGFAQLFQRVLPGARWLVSDDDLDGPGISFTLSAIDRTGRVVFEVGVAICAWTDGATEIYNHSGDVDPMYRGLGITAHCEVLQEALLRALSRHPNSRLSARPSTMTDANTGKEQLGIGAYLHAKRGYLFADSMGVLSPFTGLRHSPYDNVNRPVMHHVLMAKHFADWVMQDKNLRHGDSAADAATRRKLIELANRCRQPFEFLRLQMPGVTSAIPTPAGRKECSVGKAFLLSGWAPEWCGTRFVNPPAPEVAPSVKEVRTISQTIFHNEIEREVAASREAALRLNRTIAAQVNDADPQVRANAYIMIGKIGPAHLDRFLKKRAHGKRLFRHSKSRSESDAKAREAASQARILMTGVGIDAGLCRAKNNLTLPHEVRAAMYQRLISHRKTSLHAGRG